MSIPPLKGPAKGVVFDLDGTLVDSLATTFDAFNHGIVLCGVRPHTADEIIADLNLERKRRAERRGIKTAAGAGLGAAPAQQGTNRVINVLEIPGLRPLPGR